MARILPFTQPYPDINVRREPASLSTKFLSEAYHLFGEWLRAHCVDRTTNGNVNSRRSRKQDAVESQRMPEEFSENSNQSIRALIQYIVAIGSALKKELPFDYLTPSWHIGDGTDNCIVGISARWGEKRHSLMIYTHYLDAPPEPKEVYPEGCCAVGALQIFSPEASLRETLEICGTPERWMAHHSGKWVPLSASYVAFLMGISLRLPDAR